MLNGLPDTGRIIAFDFGLRSIGLAVGNLETGTVTPLGANPARDGKPDWGELDAQLDEWQPDALLIGIPLNMDGSESEMSRLARKFQRRLHARYHLPCHLTDERLTTVEARQDLGRQRKFNKAQLDATAAAIILKNWLEQNAYPQEAQPRS